MSAERLAAVALVVGSGEEPAAGLRRLIAADGSLRALTAVADDLEAGLALPSALRRRRLITAGEAAEMANVPAAELSEQLRRLAWARQTRVPGMILARWFPVWVICIATVPSLAIDLVVRLFSGSTFQGFVPTLAGGLYGEDHATYDVASWIPWAGTAIALLITWGLITLLRAQPILGVLTWFSGGAEVDELALRMLRRARARDPRWRKNLLFWARLRDCGREARAALDIHDDDAVAVLVRLQILERNAAGAPDWVTARERFSRDLHGRLQRVHPALVAILVLAGLEGAATWISAASQASSLLGDQWGFINTLFADPMFMGFTLEQLLRAGGAWMAAGVAILLVGVWERLRGPWRDWPLVARAFALGMRQRRDLQTVLAQARLRVARGMRHRLDRLDLTGGAPVGTALALTRVAPQRLRRHLDQAKDSELPTLLDGLDAEPPRLGLPTSVGAGFLLLFVLLLYFTVAIFPKFSSFRDSLEGDRFWSPQQDSINGFMVLDAATTSGWILISIIGSCLVLRLIGDRTGWWPVLDGRMRLARGLVASDLLRHGSDETRVARAWRRLWPRLPAQVEDRAAAGDLRGLLRGGGWDASDPQQLDQRIAATIRRHGRRRHRAAVAGMISAPIITAIPLGLFGVGLMLCFQHVQDPLRQETHHIAGGGPMTLHILQWGLELVEWQAERRLPPAQRDPDTPGVVR